MEGEGLGRRGEGDVGEESGDLIGGVDWSGGRLLGGHCRLR